MTKNFLAASAKIYEFPKGGRAALPKRFNAAKPAETDLRTQHAGNISFGGSWYHEAAVRDADHAFKP